MENIQDAQPPANDGLNIRFEDLFELEEIQMIQDQFSAATHVASYITRPDGKPLTKPSNFNTLCSDIIWKSKKGMAQCFQLNTSLHQEDERQPHVNQCHYGGLWDNSIRIIVGENHVANWYICQIQCETKDNEKLLALAKEVGADKRNYLAALDEIQLISAEQFQKVSKALFTIIKQLTDKAYQNLLQKETADLIRKDKNELSSIVNAGNIYIIKTDLNGNYTYFNRHFKDKFGWIFEGDEIIGRNALESILPDDHAKTLEFVTKCIENPNTPFNIKLRKPYRNGGTFTTRWEFSCQTDVTGNPHEILCIGFDITTEIQAEETLRASEEKYSALVENAFEGIVIISMDGLILFINPSLIRTFEYENQDEVVGKSIFNYLAPESIPQAIEDLTKVIQGISMEVANYTGITSKGNKIWVEALGKIIDYEGTKAGFISVRDVTQRKLSEARLTENEKKFRAITETANDAILVANHEGRIIFFNPKALEIFGYEEHNFLNQPLEIILPKRHLEAHEISFKKFVTDKIPHVMRKVREYAAVRQDGSEFPMEISLSNWETPEGMFVSANIRDISERIRYEKINKIQNQITTAVFDTKDLGELIGVVKKQLGTLMDTTNFYVALYNEQTGMLSAPFMRDEKDTEDEWPAERSVTGLVIREDKALLLSKHNLEALHAKGVIDIIGSPAACWLGVPLHAGQKTIGAFVLQSYTDENAYSEKDLELLKYISHHISMAIHRKNNEQKISLLGKSIEQSPVSIVITNYAGNIEYVNPKFCEVTGYSVAEVIGKNPRVLKSGLQAPEVYTELWAKLKAGQPWFGEFHNRRKNGELFWESVNISPIFNPGGKITHFVAVKEDISEKKTLFEELSIAKEKAQESDKLKTAFLNNISHEIRTPFNGILGFLSLIAEDDITKDERDQYIEMINISADRLMVTINDIVEISFIQAGQANLILSEVNISKMFQKLYAKYQFDAEKKGLKFTVQQPDIRTECKMITDELKLFSVLTNLVANAIKFTQKGAVEFGFKQTAENLLFYVKDTGIGIATSKQQSIFERFTQGDTSSTRGFEGSGLGLSIAKSYTEMLEGKIWVESNPEAGEVGSTFFVELPQRAFSFEKTKKTGTKSNISQPIQPKQTILIAEDDDINFEFNESLFLRENYAVLRAKKGTEAVSQCHNNPEIALVLMDIKMPGLNGYFAAQEIRQFNATIPIIAITAFSEPGDEEKAHESGCNTYLKKPVNRHELLKIVNEYLKK